MSFLAAFGVFVSAASLFVVLSGFSGLKEFSLGFISYTSPDLKVYANSGKSFILNEAELISLSSLSLFSDITSAVEERVLIRSNKNSQIVQLNGVDEFFPTSVIDSVLVEGSWMRFTTRHKKLNSQALM